MATISLDIEIEGGEVVSVVLSDEDATYGIKKVSDDSVVVAAGTATTQSGSTYSVTVTLDNSLEYLAAWKVTYTLDGDATEYIEYVETTIPIAVRFSSLAHLRRLLSERLGGFDLITTTTLQDNNGKVQSDDIIGLDDTSAFDGIWVLPTLGDQAGEQRRASSGTYDADEGSFLVSRNFSGALAAGTLVELHSALPAARSFRIPGLREVLNQALSHMWTRQRLDFPSSDTEFFDLTDYQWLKSKGQVTRVFRPSDTNGDYRPYEVTPAYSFQYDADDPFIQGPMVTETGWKFEVNRPANTWIKHGGSWADSTAGLQDDDDECALPPQAVIPVALYFAWEAMSRVPWEDSRRKAEYEARALSWAPVAARVMENWLPENDASPQVGSVIRGPHWGSKGLYL